MATKNSISHKSGDLTVDPGASGDSFVQFDINTTGEFRIGIDDDDSDKFKISQGSALGSNDTLTITAAGEIREPLNPAYLALSSSASNVTGDNTSYVITYGTEVFDQGGDFASNTFTAPITGRYRLRASQSVEDLTSSNTAGFVEITTSNRAYRLATSDWGNYFVTGGALNCGSFSVLADMDAADTATFRTVVSGSTKIIDVTTTGIFSGVLIA